MIVDGTVLAPLHTGLLKRRLVKLVSNVHSFNQVRRVMSSDRKVVGDVVWFAALVQAGSRGRRSRYVTPATMMRKTATRIQRRCRQRDIMDGVKTYTTFRISVSAGRFDVSSLGCQDWGMMRGSWPRTRGRG